MGFPNVLAAAGDHVIGIDLGGSYVRALLCDRDGRDVAEAAEPTPTADARSVVEAIGRLARRVVADAGLTWAQVAAVAVGVPGVADPADGTLRLAPNLPTFGELDVTARLRDELAVAVALDNDVNMATLAEHRRGLGAEARDFVFIAIGTGIGMGVVAGGRLQRGATGAAGEIAALPLGGDPFDPVNHVRGPLEEVAAGAGLAEAYAQLAGTGVAAAGELDLFAAAASGDAHAATLVARQVQAIALAVVAVHAVLDPALVVFGGGIGTRADVLDRVRGHIPQLTPRQIRIEPSALGERAGLIGAAELARDLAAAQPDEVGGR
jgi:glucokinase